MGSILDWTDWVAFDMVPGMASTPSICMDDTHSDLMAPEHARRYRTPNCYTNIVGKPLSDKKIAKYEAQGWYKDENKAARKARAEKRGKRSNFSQSPEGRLIYNPW